MNRIVLKRIYHSTDDNPTVRIAYEVMKVVGSTTPYVGEIVSDDYARDLCDFYAVWEVTFVKGATLTPPVVQVKPVDIKIRPPEQTIEQAALKANAVDFSRATNLYLSEARYVGRSLGGMDLATFLQAKTKWDSHKCAAMAKRVLDDDALVKLLDHEGIPEAYDNG